jgi:putative addiction module component (TIGR02574 family)
MPRAAEEVLNEALQLPEEDRDRIADSLWRSVRSSETEGIDEAWIAESERRCAEIDEGRVQMVPWGDVSNELKKMIAK